MSNNSLVLINRDIRLRDSLPAKDFSNKSFGGVANWIKEKYPDQIHSFLSQSVDNQLDNPDRVPIHFSYIGDDASNDPGKEIQVDHSCMVSDIVSNTFEGQVFWSIPAIGGVSALQVFGNHVLKLLTPEYQNWQLIRVGYPGYGIESRGPDKSGIIRKLIVTASANYPQEPPKIISQPPFSDDPCWDNSGGLHYTSWKNMNGSPWNLLVEGGMGPSGVYQQPNDNPLGVIISELMLKYGFGV